LQEALAQSSRSLPSEQEQTMPELDAGQKQFLEEQSVQLAEADRNISQVLATVAAAVSRASPSQATILGVGAALMGLLSDHRLAIAINPGRNDFEKVSIASPDFDPSRLPADPATNALSRFGVQQVLVADALAAVLRALERREAAVNAGNAKAAAAQLEAIGQNGRVAANMQEQLAVLGPVVDDVLDQLMASATPAAPTLDSVQSFYRKCLGDPPGSGFQLVAQAVTGAAETALQPFDFERANPILSAGSLPDVQLPVFDNSWRAGLAEVSTTLRNLVET
jgi:hypothetical protein